jgi:hypothetical protein
MQHFGSFRQPDADSWVTSFTATIAPLTPRQPVPTLQELLPTPL